jgi:hypothetical protein
MSISKMREVTFCESSIPIYKCIPLRAATRTETAMARASLSSILISFYKKERQRERGRKGREREGGRCIFFFDILIQTIYYPTPAQQGVVYILDIGNGELRAICIPLPSLFSILYHLRYPPLSPTPPPPSLLF